MDGSTTSPRGGGNPRTELAAERTKLAKERTFAAWIRTGIAAAGLGVALARLLPAAEHRWLVQLLGILFVVAGMSILVLAAKSYRNVVKRLEEHVEATVPVWAAVGLTAIFPVASTIGLIAIILD